MPQAAFFGVGAPEAVLVGVVALVVFGPKGLAEVRAGPLTYLTDSHANNRLASLSMLI